MDLYTYKAKVVNIVDGDTLDLDIFLGFKLNYEIRIRLAHVNTPEINRKASRVAGMAAKQRVANLCEKHPFVYVRTFKDSKGKYGRYIAEIIFPDETNLGDILLKEGHAVPYGK